MPRSAIQTARKLIRRLLNPSGAIHRVAFFVSIRPSLAKCGAGTYIDGPLTLINGKQIRIGAESFIRSGARLEAVNRDGLPPGQLIIGSRVSIEQSVHLVACDRVVIEDEVCMAPRCTVLDTSHPHGLPGEGNRVAKLHRDRLETRIGRRVFLGVNSVVLPGVSIGENSVIGANSVVTCDIPPNVVAVGTPARVVRSLPTEALS